MARSAEEDGTVVEIFKIEKGKYIELHDLLKVTGICSTGGAAKIAITEGMVTVDGIVEKRKRCKIKKGQAIQYRGKQIQVE